MQLVKHKQGYINVDKARFIFDKNTFSLDGMSIKEVSQPIKLSKFIYVVTNKKKNLYLPVNRVVAFNLETKQLLDCTENDRSDYKLVAQLTALEQLRVLQFRDWFVNRDRIKDISLFIEDSRGQKSYEYTIFLDGGRDISVSLDKEVEL